jgi:hypothetical protein
MATDTSDPTTGRANDPYQLDRRLTILETRFDTIVPTLATKADLSELKAELRGEIAALSRWMAAMFVTMVVGFAGMIVALLQKG